MFLRKGLKKEIQNIHLTATSLKAALMYVFGSIELNDMRSVSYVIFFHYLTNQERLQVSLRTPGTEKQTKRKGRDSPSQNTRQIKKP